MERIFFSGLEYSIEFIKLWLLVTLIFQIEVKKNIKILSALSLIGVIAAAYFVDLSKVSIVYAVIAFFVFFLSLEKKKNLFAVIALYIGISLVDILISLVFIRIFHLTQQQMQNYIMIPAINSVSLILLVLIAFILKTKQKKEIQGLKCIPILVIGGLVLTLYLTCSQYIEMRTDDNTYGKELLFSSFAITAVYILVCVLLIIYQSRNSYLNMEKEMDQRLLEQQNEYYNMLLRKEEETKMFRHDIRQHMTCIRRLCEQKNYDELEQYLAQMEFAVKELSPKISVGNHYVEMIIADLMDRDPDVTLDWKGKVPPLSMEAMDVCTLFYNLLKNAFEAAHDATAHSEVCSSVKIQGTNLMIIVSNAYETIKQDNDRNFLTTKSGQGHGYGLKNIAKCVEKYNGSCRITAEDNNFCVEILLPDIVEKDERSKLEDERYCGKA
jgi:hypothetical protein